MCYLYFSLIKLNSCTNFSNGLPSYFRHVFWTIWVSQHNQVSGLIERANMDGSERIAIISNNLLGPMSITVDHVLNMIYWVDAKLNTLESADFQGLKRY